MKGGKRTRMMPASRSTYSFSVSIKSVSGLVFFLRSPLGDGDISAYWLLPGVVGVAGCAKNTAAVVRRLRSR